jgi:tetratricopeptide (TPR) repeat protein
VEESTPTQIRKWQVEALSGQAEVRSIIGHTDEAIAGYEHALDTVAASNVFPVTCLASLYHKIAIVHHDKGQYDLAQQAVDKGLEALAGLTCLEAGRLHVYTGVILWKLGRFTDGLASCEEGIAIIEKTEGIRDLAQGYNLRGIFYRRMKESQKAIMSYERSIALYEQAEYIPGLERASYNLACVHKDLGKWEAALASFQQSSTLSERTGEVQRQGTALNGQGEIYLRLGKLEQAIEAYEQARQIFEECGFDLFRGVALMNLGASYLKKEAFPPARANLSKSMDIFQRLKANQHLPEVLRYLAELQLLSGQAASGQLLAQEAVDWALKLEHKLEEGQSKRSLGQAYREMGQLEDAAAYLDESLTILEERNIPYEVALTLVEITLLCKAQIDVEADRDALREQAITSCERAITIFNQLGAALDLKRAQEIGSSL